MKRQPGILAGTALGLLMASAPLGAFPLQDRQAPQHISTLPLLLAQDNCRKNESAEDCAARQAQSQEPQAAPEPEAQPAPAPEPEAAPAPEPAPEAAPAPEPEKKAAPEPQPQAEPAPAPAPEVVPAPAEEVAPQPQAKPAPVEQEQKPHKKKREKQAEPAPAPEPAPTPEAAPAPTPTEETAPTPQAKPAPVDEAAPEVKQEKAPAPAPAPEATKPEQSKKPVTGEQTAPAEGKQPVQGEAPADPNAAPILDSQKDARRPRDNDDKGGKREREKPANQNEQAETPAPEVDQGPPPTDDKAAQQAIQPTKIEPVTEEKGKRREKAPDRRDRDRRDGVDVLKEIGDRVIIELGGEAMVESNERPRMTHGAKDVYYEDLPRGRTRETIERGNGDQIVTIRNRHGDILQRSRITPDGREYVLNYVDESHYGDDREWRDPGDDLPPMRLTIPRNRYILDSESVDSPDDYYEFLEQPPVEKVQRLYSVQEVKRSARVRDIARRIDLDTLTFEFGSASIPDSEVQKLEGVATAMERLLEKNPAETFLIEGHTDAVGTDNANLALSDRRAEAVAEALTNAFGIPPENLATQGYGERYLKVSTDAPERQNRRVAIRRITSLVAPVASAQ
ncbi:OmpA family protein [Mesorhizobium sp. A623]